ncbi:hypothetical protein F441_15790 [Phytophthora nicotianae CJ01A1]|uniref:Uncharacterized protein n=1 Tax=Phytophthora nicotianae CJ01A1 TaxID=1317063 RepID=W2WCG1_PHYNI|nr:hypothetical protein F441_15790 [Phytophthora nicotianae CJ01A1]
MIQKASWKKKILTMSVLIPTTLSVTPLEIIGERAIFVIY